MHTQVCLQKVRKHILLILLLLCCTGPGMQILTMDMNLSFVAYAQEIPWAETLRITEPSGKIATVVFGGSPNASDARDDLDRPEPPAPPEISYIRAWFSTPLQAPFNRLLQEHKHIPADQLQWNLTILWVPEPENISLTTITIRWDPSQALRSTYSSFELIRTNTTVANMLTESSYSFPSNGTLHHFQIQCRNIPSHPSPEKNDLPILPLTFGVLVVVIVVLVAVVSYKRKK